jgi:hypothetical protein
MNTTTLPDTSDWVPIDLAIYGAGLRTPPGWEALPPVPANGHELVRASGGGSLEVIVFKLRSHGSAVGDIAARTRGRLEARGYVGFAQTEQSFAGRAGARLEFRSGTDRPVRTSWEYFAVRGPAVFVLGLSSADPDDLAMVEALASTFHLVPGD